MSTISVDLLWQRRHRGLVCVGAAGLADSGHALLVKPDEFESRTYQLLSFAPDGQAQELAAISVERMRLWIGQADGRVLLGMTDGDIYIFRDGKKARFMTERRATYADVALAPGPGWFVCAFSDALFSTHGIAMGDATGRLAWTRDLPGEVSRVAITTAGEHLVIGLPDGRVVAMDKTRTTLWERACEEEPVTALAMGAQSAACVVGTEAGTVLCLDDEGGTRWRTPIGLPIIGVAMDGSGERTAAVATDGSSHVAICFLPDGSPSWEHTLEHRPLAVTLSPSGDYLLVSCAGGEASCFFIEGAGGTGIAASQSALERARELADAGDNQGALDLLQPLILAAQHDAALASEWLRVRDAVLSELKAEAATELEAGAGAAAWRVLERAAAIDPWDEALFQLRRDCREAIRAEVIQRAQTCELLQDWPTAAASWLEAIELDPAAPEAREGLRRVREAEAKQLRRMGDEAHAAGDAAAAMAAWKDAQKLAHSFDVAEQVRQAEVAQRLQAGIRHYEAGKLPEATFQLRKVLALDPGNDEAERYLGYAQGQGADSQIADRFGRLE